MRKKMGHACFTSEHDSFILPIGELSKYGKQRKIDFMMKHFNVGADAHEEMNRDFFPVIHIMFHYYDNLEIPFNKIKNDCSSLYYDNFAHDVIDKNINME